MIWDPTTNADVMCTKLRLATTDQVCESLAERAEAFIDW